MMFTLSKRRTLLPWEVVLRAATSRSSPGCTSQKKTSFMGSTLIAAAAGFDGNQVLVTPRAAEAIRTKINTVNLSIRGECYEHRLLKYAERGFAIQVPLLERPRLNREHMSFQYEDAFGYRSIGSNGWKKLSEAVGLEKLVPNESLARTCAMA